MVLKGHSMKKLLQEARAEIEKGWSQGNFFEFKDGTHTNSIGNRRNITKCCMIGAIILHDLKYDERYGAQARELLRDIIGERLGVRDIVYFNDKVAKSKEEVLEVFDEAIRRASD